MGFVLDLASQFAADSVSTEQRRSFGSDYSANDCSMCSMNKVHEFALLTIYIIQVFKWLPRDVETNQSVYT